MTCFAGHTIRWLSSNLISFIHVIKMELTSESDIWKQLAKSCTKRLIAQKFALKPRQALTLRLTVGETINIIAL
jgi:hypothetical protein